MGMNKKETLKWLEQLADLMNEKGLNSIELDSEDFSLHLEKANPVASVVTSVAPTPAPALAMAPATAVEQVAPAQESLENHPGAVKSPIVGTVYLSSQPGSPPLVNEGDAVKEGQTLLIVEAMKVMNTIQAHKAGTLTKMLVSNEEPVEYGQVLAIIE